jgi:hypothetical protein
MSVFLQPIYTQTVGSGGANAITFNNIPQSFTDLKVVISARSSGSFDASAVTLYPNAATGDGLQSGTELFANQNGTGSYRANNIFSDTLPGANVTANTFNNLEFYIPNYTSSNFKQIIVDGVTEANNTTMMRLCFTAGLWRSTSSITSLQLGLGSAFVQYSTFSLYGITKG